MSITAEYRRISQDQLVWFTKKPSALYELLFPDSIEAMSGEGREPKAKSVGVMLADFQKFASAMQNPGTNDELLVSKLPFMMQQWRAMLGEEGAQQILELWAKEHPAVAEHLKRSPSAVERKPEDVHVLNIEKAWEGIHFVLTAAKEPSDTPISRAIFGDRVVPDTLSVMGYGPAHLLTSSQVEESARELRRMEPELVKRFDVKTMVTADVYAIHDDPAELSYLQHHYDRLLTFYEEAASQRQGMAVYFV